MYEYQDKRHTAHLFIYGILFHIEGFKNAVNQDVDIELLADGLEPVSENAGRKLIGNTFL